MSQKTLKKRVYLQLAGKRILRNAATIHFTSEREHIQARLVVDALDSRSSVLPLPMTAAEFIDLRDGLLVSRFLAPQVTLGYLGRLHPKKRVELLLTSAADLLEEGFDVRVLIAGTGDGAYVESLHGLAATAKLRGLVHFVGAKYGPEKHDFLRSVDFLVLPTLQENFGYVVAEALAVGTPVITTEAVHGAQEWATSGAAIILPVEAFAFRKGLLGFLVSPEAVSISSSPNRLNAQQWLRDRLVGRAMQDGYTSLYARVVGTSASEA